jgi:hypothetical protein
LIAKNSNTVSISEDFFGEPDLMPLKLTSEEKNELGSYKINEL